MRVKNAGINSYHSYIFFALIDFHCIFGLTSVYGVEMFSKDVKPFGISYDDWVAKYWNKGLR